jgi:hypothetical protein
VSDTDSHSICWLYGIAGSGKSAIAQSISERIAKNELAASFFFNRRERERSGKEYIITTIAYQLAISVPPLKSVICDVIAKDETYLECSLCGSAAEVDHRASADIHRFLSLHH